jgi:hypothetical protein
VVRFSSSIGFISLRPEQHSVRATYHGPAVRRPRLGRRLDHHRRRRGERHPTHHHLPLDEDPQRVLRRPPPRRAEFVLASRDKLYHLSNRALDTLLAILDNPKSSPAVLLRTSMFILQRPQMPKTGWSMPEPSPDPDGKKLLDSAIIEQDYDSLPGLYNIERDEPAETGAPAESAPPEPPPPAESPVPPPLDPAECIEMLHDSPDYEDVAPAAGDPAPAASSNPPVYPNIGLYVYKALGQRTSEDPPVYPNIVKAYLRGPRSIAFCWPPRPIRAIHARLHRRTDHRRRQEAGLRRAVALVDQETNKKRTAVAGPQAIS